MEAFIETPRTAAVYNLGGGKENSVSMLEAFDRVERLTGKPMNWSYSEQHREGDHICYYSDLSKMRADYPSWEITVDLDATFTEIVRGWEERLAGAETLH
jgi:CDP-paratose 2-epimerase